MTKPKFRVGQRVVASDLRSLERGRRPDRCEGVGVVRDLFAPYGRQTAKKDKTPPYFVETPSGCTAWYDEDELKKIGPDWVGVDSRPFPGVDVVLDLTARTHDAGCNTHVGAARCDCSANARDRLAPFAPWPWADASIDEAHSSHFIEHLTAPERAHFVNELYRVLASSRRTGPPSAPTAISRTSGRRSSDSGGCT